MPEKEKVIIVFLFSHFFPFFPGRYSFSTVVGNIIEWVKRSFFSNSRSLYKKNVHKKVPNSFFLYLHWVPKKHIYLSPYIVCNEWILDGLQLPLGKIFWSQIIIAFVAHLKMLHLIPFASKSVIFSSHNESLKLWEISCLASILLQKRQNSAFDWAFKHPVRLQ